MKVLALIVLIGLATAYAGADTTFVNIDNRTIYDYRAGTLHLKDDTYLTPREGKEKCGLVTYKSGLAGQSQEKDGGSTASIAASIDPIVLLHTVNYASKPPGKSISPTLSFSSHTFNEEEGVDGSGDVSEFINKFYACLYTSSGDASFENYASLDWLLVEKSLMNGDLAETVEFNDVASVPGTANCQDVVFPTQFTSTPILLFTGESRGLPGSRRQPVLLHSTLTAFWVTNLTASGFRMCSTSIDHENDVTKLLHYYAFPRDIALSQLLDEKKRNGQLLYDKTTYTFLNDSSKYYCESISFDVPFPHSPYIIASATIDTEGSDFTDLSLANMGWVESISEQGFVYCVSGIPGSDTTFPKGSTISVQYLAFLDGTFLTEEIKQERKGVDITVYVRSSSYFTHAREDDYIKTFLRFLNVAGGIDINDSRRITLLSHWYANRLSEKPRLRHNQHFRINVLPEDEEGRDVPMEVAQQMTRTFQGQQRDPSESVRYDSSWIERLDKVNTDNSTPEFVAATEALKKFVCGYNTGRSTGLLESYPDIKTINYTLLEIPCEERPLEPPVLTPEERKQELLKEMEEQKEKNRMEGVDEMFNVSNWKVPSMFFSFGRSCVFNEPEFTACTKEECSEDVGVLTVSRTVDTRYTSLYENCLPYASQVRCLGAPCKVHPSQVSFATYEEIPKLSQLALGKPGLSTGVIVGIVIGVIAVVLIIVLVVLRCLGKLPCFRLVKRSIRLTV